VVESQSLDYAAWSCTLGLLVMFLTMRMFHVHQHAPGEEFAAEPAYVTCGHAHHAGDHAHEHAASPGRRVSWVGLFVGLGIHSLLDGVAVGASLLAGTQHGSAWGLIGAGTFLAVFMHKPLDALSITSVMAVGNWSPRAQSIVNAVFSLICPAGLLLTYLGVQSMGAWQHIAVGCALGFSAGVFLCIALADILPEIQFHRHDRFVLTAALLTGVALAFTIGVFEPEHAHDHTLGGHDHGAVSEQDGHVHATDKRAVDSPDHDHDHDHVH
jgi:zinc and cadmium transporter